jgi:hypothetical protein
MVGEVGGGMSNCDLISCCADSCSNCFMLAASCPSFVDRLSLVDGEIVPVSVCDGAGEESRELSAFRLTSLGVVAAGAWASDGGTCKDAVPEPSDTARPSN